MVADLGIEILNLFQSLGVYTIIGPFLVIFSLFYGLLRKSGIFGRTENKEKIYALISFILAIYFLYNIEVVNFTQNFLSFFFYELLVIFLLLIAVSIIGNAANITGSSHSDVLVGILGLTVVIAFLYATSVNNTFIGSTSQQILYTIWNYLVSTGYLLVIVLFLGIIAIVAWIASPPTTNWKQKSKNFLEDTLKTLHDLYEKSK